MGAPDLGWRRTARNGTTLRKVPALLRAAVRLAAAALALARGSAAAAQPAAAPAAPLAAGVFHDGEHATRGRAEVLRLPDGRRVLRLRDFETARGPDVRVLLVAAPDVRTGAALGRATRVDLGALRRRRGDQEYALGADVDLTGARTVTIWCRRFRVHFGSAPLTTAARDSLPRPPGASAP